MGNNLDRQGRQGEHQEGEQNAVSQASGQYQPFLAAQQRLSFISGQKQQQQQQQQNHRSQSLNFDRSSQQKIRTLLNESTTRNSGYPYSIKDSRVSTQNNEIYLSSEQSFSTGKHARKSASCHKYSASAFIGSTITPATVGVNLTTASNSSFIQMPTNQLLASSINQIHFQPSTVLSQQSVLRPTVIQGYQQQSNPVSQINVYAQQNQGMGMARPPLSMNRVDSRPQSILISSVPIPTQFKSSGGNPGFVGSRIVQGFDQEGLKRSRSSSLLRSQAVASNSNVAYDQIHIRSIGTSSVCESDRKIQSTQGTTTNVGTLAINEEDSPKATIKVVNNFNNSVGSSSDVFVREKIDYLKQLTFSHRNFNLINFISEEVGEDLGSTSQLTERLNEPSSKQPIEVKAFDETTKTIFPVQNSAKINLESTIPVPSSNYFQIPKQQEEMQQEILRETCNESNGKISLTNRSGILQETNTVRTGTGKKPLTVSNRYRSSSLCESIKVDSISSAYTSPAKNQIEDVVDKEQQVAGIINQQQCENNERLPLISASNEIEQDTLTAMNVRKFILKIESAKKDVNPASVLLQLQKPQLQEQSVVTPINRRTNVFQHSILEGFQDSFGEGVGGVKERKVTVLSTDQKSLSLLDGEEEAELETVGTIESSSQNQNFENIRQKRSKIKIFHEKFEHIKINQSKSSQDLILYKLDQQLNALIPVLIDTEYSPTYQQRQHAKYTDLSVKQNCNSLLTEQKSAANNNSFSNSSNKNNKTINGSGFPLQKKNMNCYPPQQLQYQQQRDLSSNKKKGELNSSSQRTYFNNNDQLKKISGVKRDNSTSNNNQNLIKEINKSEKKVPPNNAYHKVLMKYSEKMLNEISQSILAPPFRSASQMRNGNSNAAGNGSASGGNYLGKKLSSAANANSSKKIGASQRPQLLK